MTKLSKTYRDAMTAHNQAASVHREVAARYLDGRVSDEEYVAVKARYAEATAIFDAAFDAETDRLAALDSVTP